MTGSNAGQEIIVLGSRGELIIQLVCKTVNGSQMGQSLYRRAIGQQENRDPIPGALLELDFEHGTRNMKQDKPDRYDTIARQGGMQVQKPGDCYSSIMEAL